MRYFNVVALSCAYHVPLLILIKKMFECRPGGRAAQGFSKHHQDIAVETL
jgi:hypothetical protein